MEKVCPRCSKTFQCMHDDIANCHCAGIELDSMQRHYLKENYHSCLCHSCLLEVKEFFYACDVNPEIKRKQLPTRSNEQIIPGRF